MRGRSYYLTTLSAWRNESGHFITSHYMHTEPASPASQESKIWLSVEADEGTHNSLSQDPLWKELPHPLSPTIIPEAIAQVLAPLGVTAFSSSFETTEAIAKLHPILRHRVF